MLRVADKLLLAAVPESRRTHTIDAYDSPLWRGLAVALDWSCWARTAPAGLAERGWPSGVWRAC